MNVSIIIPAINEEKRIGATLKKYGEFFEKKKGGKEIGDFEIIVVLNACRDNTLEVVKKSQNKYPEIRFLNFKQGGKGFAIIEGFKDALTRENDLIGFVDADMATSPEAFFDLVEKIGGYDGIIASRWVKGAIQNYSLKRKIMSKGFNFLARSILFLPYSDTQCGAKLFRGETIRNVVNELGATEWAFDIDLLFKLKKMKFRVKEIPTTWEDKEGSTINFARTPLQMFLALMRIRIINSRFIKMQIFFKPIAGWLWRKLK